MIVAERFDPIRLIVRLILESKEDPHACESMNEKNADCTKETQPLERNTELHLACHACLELCLFFHELGHSDESKKLDSSIESCDFGNFAQLGELAIRFDKYLEQKLEVNDRH